jgi:hypothetical protein
VIGPRGKLLDFLFLIGREYEIYEEKGSPSHAGLDPASRQNRMDSGSSPE